MTADPPRCAVRGPGQRDRPHRLGATDEEIAAVLAALTQLEPKPAAGSGYERWRRTRLAALRGVSAQPRR